ncbi:GNAT family N-acetyltransferase, partial [Streptomyces anthocyanicus]
MNVDRVDEHGVTALLDGLAGLLADTVAGGASVGFLAPLTHAEAAHWWRGRAAAVAAGQLAVWVAREGERVTGTVSLALPDKPNSRHRAELVKLMVSRSVRGRGVGRRL